MEQENMTFRSFLTRKLTVVKDGVCSSRGLSIINTGCSPADGGQPVLISCHPFVKETEGVEYLESAVEIRSKGDGTCLITGLPYRERTFRECIASSGFASPKT